MSDTDTALDASRTELAELTNQAGRDRLAPVAWDRLLQLQRIIAAAEVDPGANRGAAEPRICDYCQQPAIGGSNRIIPGNPASPLCGYGPGHEDCLPQHYDAIRLHDAGDLAAATDLREAADRLRSRGHG